MSIQSGVPCPERRCMLSLSGGHCIVIVARVVVLKFCACIDFFFSYFIIIGTVDGNAGIFAAGMCPVFI